MNDKFFGDTNIFVYSYDASAPAKQSRAKALIQNAISNGIGIVSYQVIQEFSNRFGLTEK